MTWLAYILGLLAGDLLVPRLWAWWQASKAEMNDSIRYYQERMS